MEKNEKMKAKSANVEADRVGVSKKAFGPDRICSDYSTSISIISSSNKSSNKSSSRSAAARRRWEWRGWGAKWKGRAGGLIILLLNEKQVPYREEEQLSEIQKTTDDIQCENFLIGHIRHVVVMSLPLGVNITPQYSFVDIHVDRGMDDLYLPIADCQEIWLLWSATPDNLAEMKFCCDDVGRFSRCKFKHEIIAHTGQETARYLPFGWTMQPLGKGRDSLLGSLSGSAFDKNDLGVSME